MPAQLWRRNEPLRSGQRPGPVVRRDAGFTLIEVVAAMALFSVVAIFTLAMVLRLTQGTRQNDSRVAAASLVNRQIEAVRGTEVIDIPDGLQVSTVTVGPTTYTIRQNASLVATGSAASLCGSRSNELAYKLVTVTVTWPGMGATAPVRADTLKALGPNVLDPTRGSLAVLVMRADATPVDGVRVTLSPGGHSVTVGADGCAVFSQVPVGTYVAQVDARGFVGARDTQLATTGSIGVTAGEVAHAELLYDASAALTVLAGGPDTAWLPTDVPLMMRSSYLTDTLLPRCGPVSACISGLPGEVLNLFPTQRTFWAGSCHDAKTSESTVVADIPSDSGVTVPLATATVLLERRGIPQPGRRLYAVHAPDAPSTPVPACLNGVVHRLPDSEFLGVQVRLPYGTWTFSTNPNGNNGTTVTLGSTPTVATVGAR